MIDLFAFDGDGCAFNTMEHATNATFSAAHSLGEPATKNNIREAFSKGLPLPEIFATIAPDADQDEMLQRFYECGDAEGYESIRLFPGVAKALAVLKGDDFRLVLVTNRNSASTQAILKQTRLSTFIHEVITSDDVKSPKPNPECLFRAMSSQQAEADDTIYMGDTPGDILTGINASVACTIGFDGGFATTEQLRAAGANHIISSWAFLPNLLKQINVID